MVFANDANARFVWDLLSFLTDLATVIISLVVLCFAVTLRDRLSLGEQIANIPELLNDLYIFGKIPPPHFEVESKKYVKIKKLKYFRDARNIINSKIKDEELSLECFYENTLKIGKTWENNYTYHVSISLNQLGLMILSGAVPINLALSNISDIILLDWMYCKKLIKKIRLDDPIKCKTEHRSDIYIIRKNAEWIAYAAAIYKLNKWTGFKCQKTIRSLGEKSYEDIKKREIILRKHEILNKKVSKSIHKFLYNTHTR